MLVHRDPFWVKSSKVNVTSESSWPRRHCVRWRPSSPPPADVYCGQTVAHLIYCCALVNLMDWLIDRLFSALCAWVCIGIDYCWFQLAHIDQRDSEELFKTGIVRFLPLRYSLDAEERQEAVVAEIRRRCWSLSQFKNWSVRWVGWKF